jgi:hypothetical protein
VAAFALLATSMTQQPGKRVAVQQFSLLLNHITLVLCLTNGNGYTAAPHHTTPHHTTSDFQPRGVPRGFEPERRFGP